MKYSYANQKHRLQCEAEADAQVSKTPNFIKKVERGLEYINTTKQVIPLKETLPSCLTTAEAQITVALRNLEAEDSTFVCGIHITSHIYRRKIRYNVQGKWYSLAAAVSRVLEIANS